MNYFLEVGRKFKILEVDDPEIAQQILYSGRKILCHYTVKFKIPDTYANMQLYWHTMVITDDDTEKDVVTIDSLFMKKDKVIIDFALKHNINVDEIFHIDLYLDEKLVDRSKVIVDWNELSVTNIKPKINDCYTLVVYKQFEKYNRLIRMMDHLTNKEYN
jgi:hypothetical protein